MSRRIESDSYQRWFIDENQLSVSFNNWSAEIRPIFVKNNSGLRWAVTFLEGGGNKNVYQMYCENIEDSINLIERYKKIIHFDELLDALHADHN
jgi:hypothetical protein